MIELLQSWEALTGDDLSFEIRQTNQGGECSQIGQHNGFYHRIAGSLRQRMAA